MFTTRRLLGPILALACLLAPAFVRAAGAPEHDLRAIIHGDEVRAGEMIEIHWNDPGVEVPEIEILLSLDGGAHYPLRVSPELDPRAGRFRWRVPNLSSADARLRIRFGHGPSENWGEPGASFRIVGAPGAADLDQICEYGWWSGLDAPIAGPRAGVFDSSSERITRGTTAVTTAIVPGGSDDVRPVRSQVGRDVRQLSETSPPPRSGGTIPRLMVMRN